jgi:hydroxypyruvate reductase
MPPAADKLRRDARRIWWAGVEAVRSDRLVRQTLRLDGSTLTIGEQTVPLEQVGRIAVVGAGKAGAGMAAAVEEVLGPQWIEAKAVTGWVNVPDDCVRGLSRIHLHGARPAGVNEPTPAGAAGAAEILRIVQALGPEDLCLALISGGGSALMPAPVEGVSLADKLAVTRHLSAAGANIEELNTVRKQLSRLKGGGLARACRAGRLAALIISDVLGDPLEIIASGPTVEDSSTPEAALAILDRYQAKAAGVPQAVFDYLAARCRDNRTRHAPRDADPHAEREEYVCPVWNLVVGNNATAVDAAGQEAERLGYSHAMTSAARSEGAAEEVGRRLAAMALSMRGRPGPNCLISGGEPVVKLAAAEKRGLGGRNQQLVLAALAALASDGAADLAILSGGTDGEDGPTDAAGAFLDEKILSAARQQGLDPADYLARNDAYHFFAPLDALLRTGPTHTNVCDVRVVLAQSPSPSGRGLG